MLAADANHADARWQMGLIQGFEGDFDGSLLTLAQLVSEYPSHVSARYDLAMTLAMLGMTDEACFHFREVLRLNPTHDKARQQIVYCP